MEFSTIAELLDSLHLSNLLTHFEKTVDLQILTEAEIKELIPQVGARRKILIHLANLNINKRGLKSNSDYNGATCDELQASTSTASTIILEHKAEERSYILDSDEDFMDIEKSDSCPVLNQTEKSIDPGALTKPTCETYAMEAQLMPTKEISNVSNHPLVPSKRWKGMRRFFLNRVTSKDIIQQNSTLHVIKEGYMTWLKEIEENF